MGIEVNVIDMMTNVDVSVVGVLVTRAADVYIVRTTLFVYDLGARSFRRSC